MKLDVILKDLPVISLTGDPRSEVTGVVCDSRQSRPGYLFVAVPGDQQDGWGFVDDAISRGATVVVSEARGRIRRDVTHVVVENARRALGLAAAAFHGRPSDALAVTGITGTNGKTTTAYMIRSMLRAAGREPGLIGTVEYNIGARAIPASRTTPDAPTLQSMLAQMAGSGCRSVVMEVSSHALDQDRVAGIDFDVGVFTNLTRDHLDYHQTMDRYFEAKARLFASLGTGRKPAATAVINADDPRTSDLTARLGPSVAVLAYGSGAAATVRAQNIRFAPSGTAFTLGSPWGSAEIKSRFLGRFNVANALAAIAAGSALGVDLATMAGVFMSETLTVPGRLEEVSTGRGFQVFVDYAHTDDALANVLRTLRETVRGRLIVVFGCGGNRDRSKRPLMGKVASELADLAILTSDNPRKEDPGAILAEVRVGFGAATNYQVIEDRAEAIASAVSQAGDGDVVLIAGKGHESFQECANRTLPFDDRQVVKRYL